MHGHIDTRVQDKELRTCAARAHTQVKNLHALFALDPEDIDEVLSKPINPKPFASNHKPKSENLNSKTCPGCRGNDEAIHTKYTRTHIHTDSGGVALGDSEEDQESIPSRTVSQ